MSKFALVFPGQGSQSVGMLAALNDVDSVISKTFEEAGEVLGCDLWSIASKGPAELLNSTELTQPLMLAGGVAVWRFWLRAGGQAPAAVAGHSLGEYSALVSAGVLDFRDAVNVVSERARLMQSAVPAGEGAMAAILGLADEVVEAICREVAEDQVVAPANYNSPGQLVVAGDSAAVERVTHACVASGARKALKLPVSVPSHCALMAPAAEELAAVLAGISFGEPAFPIYHNVDAGIRVSPDGIREALLQQLSAPVQWTATIEALVKHDIGIFAESGPGRVLCGLGKRIERSVEWVVMEQPDSIQSLLEKTAKESVEE
ncbi:MAG: ACP S-malonyltransferase [Wenzhouxiangella sp.]|nr:ACP S-malonyltransferase [Wenzhouxiangella sp.]